jgi:Cof subfamily protein (haloacid dehalogenase superfamily)
MTHTNHSENLRLAAIDLDGTLLGPDLHISRENHAAIDRLAAAGMEIVIATGRHYRSIAPFLRELPQVKWIVTSQGAEVARADRSGIVAQNFLRDTDVRALIDAASHPHRSNKFTPVYYTADEVFTDTPANDHLHQYAALSGRLPDHVTRDAILRMQVQKVLWMGAPQHIDALRTDRSLAALRLQGLQTMDNIYEFMPLETSKAWGLQILSNNLGLTPQNAVVFGDGENDIPMFDWAGLSYAMPHGWQAALTIANRTAPAGPPHTAFARAVHQLLS